MVRDCDFREDLYRRLCALNRGRSFDRPAPKPSHAFARQTGSSNRPSVSAEPPSVAQALPCSVWTTRRVRFTALHVKPLISWRWTLHSIS
jgi:hypothetical protein